MLQATSPKGFKRIKPRQVVGLLAVLLALIFVFSFTLGRYPVEIDQVIKILSDRVLRVISGGKWGFAKTWTPAMENAVLKIRFPRIALAAMVGCCLSAAGVSYQGVFQNPMASPDILGASSGAAFGAALAILRGGTALEITLWAFLSSLVTVALVFTIACKAPGLRVVNLILAGIMIGSLFTAGTSYVKLVADPTNQLPAITYWLMGSLSGAKNRDVWIALAPMALGCAVLYLIRWRINVLTLGDDEAKALGVHADRLRLLVIIASTLITAASISAAGMIGWVGLVIPHLCRKVVGGDYTYLMPATMLAGGTFLLVVDNISRNLLNVEIPIGILTALVGAPFFIYLLMKQEKTI